jgi:hypothetical protein
LVLTSNARLSLSTHILCHLFIYLFIHSFSSIDIFEAACGQGSRLSLHHLFQGETTATTTTNKNQSNKQTNKQLALDPILVQHNQAMHISTTTTTTTTTTSSNAV